jgi:flavin-dependent dehydrogenase
LPEEAFGLSRYAFDDMLVTRARELGAAVIRARPESSPEPLVIAHGRDTANTPARGRRLFGFKAHFDGPAEDAIELYFSRYAYVGVNPVEGGRTNVCGLAPEWRLRQSDFEFDDIVDSFPPLRDRLRPLRRSMEWLAAGPLVYGNNFRRRGAQWIYPAGDALSFVDPFTGSGILAAVATGSLAGTCAAAAIQTSEYLKMCRARLAAPFRVSSVFRAVLRLGWADRIGPLVPPELLFRLTRPLLAQK